MSLIGIWSIEFNVDVDILNATTSIGTKRGKGDFSEKYSISIACLTTPIKTNFHVHAIP